MAQKTALDRYRAKLLSVALVANSIRDVFENEEKYFLQAKELEKKQIEKAFSDGQETPLNHPTLSHYSREEYYNETYNK